MKKLSKSKPENRNQKRRSDVSIETNTKLIESHSNPKLQIAWNFLPTSFKFLSFARLAYSKYSEEEEGEIDLLEMVMAGGNGTSTGTSSNHVNEYYKCCESQFFIQIVVIAMLVVIAGMMSGLTLGLMSMSLVDLEVLAKSGTPKDRLHACIFPFLLPFLHHSTL